MVVTILLAITIVGCALFLLYPFLFLYLILLLILGYATVAYRLGRWVEGRFNRNFGSPNVTALVGVGLIQIWSVLGSLFDIPPYLGPFAVMFGIVGFLAQAAAWIVGFGAVILARFGTSPGYWPRQGAPVPPPPPPYAQPAAPADGLPLTDPMADMGDMAEPRWEEPEPYLGTYPPPPPPEGEPR